jgi:hypothetical protein
MRRIAAILATTLAAAALTATPAHAATGTLTPPDTATAGTYVTITATDALAYSTTDMSWNPAVNGGWANVNCTATVVGSYNTTPQHVEGVCSGPGSLTGWVDSSATSFTVTTATQTLTVAVGAVPPPPAPAPAPVIVSTTEAAGTGWVITVTNVGDADWVNGSYYSTLKPATIAQVSAPGFTSGCVFTYSGKGGRKTKSGFRCSGATLAPAQATTIVVAS